MNKVIDERIEAKKIKKVSGLWFMVYGFSFQVAGYRFKKNQDYFHFAET